MKIIVDTCIWSYAFRHKSNLDPAIEAHKAELGELINEARVCIIGPIRQEILSGIKSVAQFKILRETLSGFVDTDIVTSDYEDAADFFNQSRAKGIQGSNTDFLICAISARLNFPIYTADGDFILYKKCFPVKIYQPRFLQYKKPASR